MELNRTSRGVIVAPAGHGKTHLVAARVKKAESDERLLVLTHTNVAVRALRKSIGTEARATVRIETLDALSLRVAAAFPQKSGVTIGSGEHDTDWENCIRPGAISVLENSAIRQAFTDSYTGIIVDEFQDCTAQQIALIGLLSKDIATVVLGDPMQSVFQFVPNEVIDWNLRTSGHPYLGELKVPWRWKKNPQLGQWILASRKLLADDKPVSITETSPIEICSIRTPVEQGGISKLLQSLEGKTAVISGESRNPNRVIGIAKGNRWGRCEVFETASPVELFTLAQAHQDDTTVAQTLAIIAFAKKCMTHVSKVSGLASCLRNLEKSGTVGRSKSEIAQKLTQFLEAPSGRSAAAILGSLRNDKKTHIFRPTLLRLAVRTYSILAATNCVGFAGSLSEVLQERKYVNEHPRGPVVGTPLRMKGLEFDNVVITDPHCFTSVEQLYVAISRPSCRIIFVEELENRFGDYFRFTSGLGSLK